MYNTLAECPVSCLQHEGELQEFLEIYKEMKPKKVMEIGSFFGGTLWFFLKNNPELESLISLDLHISPQDPRHVKMIESQNQWYDWIPDIVEFQQYKGNSHDAALIQCVIGNNTFKDIDLLHIDGDHSYEGVKQDYENFKSLVKPGGIIVFHDVVGIPEVAKFWNELTNQFPENYRTISHNGGWGIGILAT